MSAMLDKSITLSVRQVWRWTRRTLYLLIPIYFVLIFFKGWEVKMGGVSLQRSPFKDRVPEECVSYANRIGPNNHYVPNSRSLTSDVLLLRGRVSEFHINNLLTGSSAAPKCFGYAILNGMHGREDGNANFIERWVDGDGKPVLSVRVEYHQTLEDIGFTPQQETSK